MGETVDAQITTANDFEDGDDTEMTSVAELLEKSVSSVPHQPAPKRKLSPDKSADHGGKRQKENEFGSALLEQIRRLDPTKQWTIHDYLDTFKEDPLVKEYVDLLVKIELIPTSPKEADIEYFGIRKNLRSLSVAKVINCMHLLFTYFQTRYFQKNMEGANEHNKSVVNVHAKVLIPDFKDVPLKVLKQLQDDRQSCALNLQSHAAEGAKFMLELIKLRVANEIFSEISPNHTCKISLCSELQIHFNVLFTKARLEFFSAFPTKHIEWSDVTNKITLQQSYWRTENKPVPTTRNRFAVDLEEKLRAQDTPLNSTSVYEENKFFVENSDSIMEKARKKRQTRRSVPNRTYIPGPSQNGNAPPSITANENRTKSSGFHAPPPKRRHNYSGNGGNHYRSNFIPQNWSHPHSKWNQPPPPNQYSHHSSWNVQPHPPQRSYENGRQYKAGRRRNKPIHIEPVDPQPSTSTSSSSQPAQQSSTSGNPRPTQTNVKKNINFAGLD